MATQLVVASGPDKGRVFPLGKGTLVIGRGSKTQTQLVDPRVSRAHCEIEWDGHRAVVHDAGSGGGTFVNGRRTTTAELKPGDILRVGDTDLIYKSDVDEAKTMPPAAAVVLVNRPGQRRLPPALKQLQELAGQSLGNYHLLKVVGVGQTGVVFQARDAKDQKLVALKVLRQDFAKDAKAVQRFVRGMKTARFFEHPNLVGFYNAGIAKPYCWMAMELIDGPSLADMLANARTGLDWASALRVAIHLARALAYLHGRDILHRNVIPPNILIQKRDQAAKLGDAMLAKSLQGASVQDITQSGELVGNMFYMAPERTRPNAAVDGRTDLYALGATLYHTLTGRAPFQAASLPELVLQIRQAQPERLKNSHADLPPRFEAIVLQTLAKTLEQRPASATELLTHLEPIAREHKVKV